MLAYMAEHADVAQEIRFAMIEHAKAECQMAPAAASLPAAQNGAAPAM